MSTQYNGIDGNVSRGSQFSISSSTNATPISVTTGANHLLTTGDVVHIEGHRVNTNANGDWVVTVTGLNTVTLNTSVGNGVGAATGTLQGLGLIPDSFAIPSDGDAPNAASVNVAFEAVGDRTAWLARRTGAYRLVSETILSVDDNHNPLTVWAGATTNNTAAWVAISNTQVWNTNNGPTVNTGDWVEVELVTSAANNAGASYAPICIFQNIYAPGAAVGSYTKVPGSAQAVEVSAGWQPLHLFGRFQAAATGYLSLQIYLFGVNPTGPQAQLGGDYQYVARVWRPN